VSSKKHREDMGAIIIALGMVVALLGLNGCGAAAPARPEAVRIGVIYPLSGSLASTGQALRQAVELAQEIVNQEHDLGLCWEPTIVASPPAPARWPKRPAFPS